MARVREVGYDFAVHVKTDTASVETHAVLLYSVDEPLQVSLYTDASLDDVELGVVDPWVFSRELLVYAVAGPVGIGDVRVDTGGETCIVSLSSPYGAAQVTFRWVDVVRFITATVELVPLGREVVFVPDDISSI